MMKCYFSSDINKDEYDEFIINHASSFMQTSSWKEVKSNWKSYLCGLYQDNKLKGVCLILEKKLFLNINLFYIPRGYVLDSSNKELLEEFTKEIKKFSKLHHAYAVKLDPNFCVKEELNIENTYNYYEKDIENKHQNLLRLGYHHKGYKKEIDAYLQPRYQMMIPLCDSNKYPYTKEEIKKNCKKKVAGYFGSYHEKRGVFFTKSNDIKDLDEFMKVIKLTEKRQNISLRNKEYFESILNNLDAYIFLGKLNLNIYLKYLKEENKDLDDIKLVEDLLKEGQNIITLSTAIVIFPINKVGIRTSEYLYAANNLLFAKLNVSVGLVYDICLESLEKKCDFCNLGGVSGYLNDHLYTFKSKFNSNVVEYVGEYDLIINKFLYYPIDLLLPLIKKVIKVGRKCLKRD